VKCRGVAPGAGTDYDELRGRHRRLVDSEESGQRLLERFGNETQEPGGISAVDDAVIVGQRKRQDLARHEGPLDPYRLGPSAGHAENGYLRDVDDRRERRTANAAEVADTEHAARHLVEAELAVARLLRDGRQLRGNPGDRLGVDVAKDGHEQAVRRVDSNADVAVLLVDDRLAGHVDRRGELRESIEREGDDLHEDGRDG